VHIGGKLLKKWAKWTSRSYGVKIMSIINESVKRDIIYTKPQTHMCPIIHGTTLDHYLSRNSGMGKHELKFITMTTLRHY